MGRGRQSTGTMSETLVVPFLISERAMEIWKDIQGYEGLYQVSNLGNVRSLNWRNTGEVRNLYLKPHKQGYLQVELHKDSERKMFTVHRLVAVHFVEGFDKDKVVNHKNENKTDNRSDNLEWVSSSFNRLYSRKEENRCDIPIIQLSLTGEIIREWLSPRTIRDELGYSDWSIKECCKGKRQQAYGYKWQYAI